MVSRESISPPFFRARQADAARNLTKGSYVKNTSGGWHGEKERRSTGHYMETLGNIPGPIATLMKYDPTTLEGYTTIRKGIMKEPPKGALPLKFKEVIFVVLDCVAGNLSGAKNHVRAALRAGLTMAELVEALVQVMMVAGIASWGMVGYQVVEFAAQISKKKNV